MHGSKRFWGSKIMKWWSSHGVDDSCITEGSKLEGPEGGDEGGLKSTEISSITTGSMAAGLWDEDEDATAEGEVGVEELEGPAKWACDLRWTRAFRFLIRWRTGLPSTLFWRMLTHSSASSGVGAIKTNRSCSPSDGPLLKYRALAHNSSVGTVFVPWL